MALTSTQNNISSTAQSPSQTVNISYNFPFVRDGDNVSFLTMSIASVPHFSDLKIVGGIYTDTNNFAQYAIVNASLVSQDDLAIGQTSQFINTPRFELSGDSSDDYQLAAIDGQNNADNTLAAAKSWFSSPKPKMAC